MLRAHPRVGLLEVARRLGVARATMQARLEKLQARVQPWPGEVLEQRAGDIAAGFAALLTRQAAWRHRRVETIAVLSHEQVRRSVSVDFTVPVEHREDVRLSETEWVVPLALLAKRELVHFDLRMEDLSSVPLLRSEEAQAIARELLYLMLDLDAADDDEAAGTTGDEEAGPVGAARTEALRSSPAVAASPAAGEVDAGSLVERVLAAGPEDAAAVDAELAALEQRVGPLPGFAALAERLTRGFLLCAVVNDVARRRVLKFAYDEPLDRPDRASHFYDAPGCTEAASYHAEVDVPDELRARTTAMIDNLTGEVLASGPRDADRPAVYYVAAAGTRMEPGLSVRYGTERGRFLVPAALVAWVIALELALPWLLADLRALATQGGPAIAVLLSSSALFSGLVLRSGEHPLVRLVLAPYRLCLAAATVAAVGAGASLAFRASSGTLAWSWGIGAVAAVAAAGILTLQAARAPSARVTSKDR